MSNLIECRASESMGGLFYLHNQTLAAALRSPCLQTKSLQTGQPSYWACSFICKCIASLKPICLFLSWAQQHALRVAVIHNHSATHYHVGSVPWLCWVGVGQPHWSCSRGGCDQCMVLQAPEINTALHNMQKLSHLFPRLFWQEHSQEISC